MTSIFCRCGGKLGFAEINRNNLDVDVVVLRCKDDSTHVAFVDVPLTGLPKHWRRFKAKFENRENSWRNKLFNCLGLCVCTNSYHGHRAGIHRRSMKGDELCQKCVKAMT